MKKIIFIAVLVLITGGILIAVSLSNQSTLTTSEISAIKSNCAQCHSVPPIQDRRTIHSLHNNFQCASCHQGTGNNNGEDDEEGPVNSSVCASCHSEPVYSSALQMHNAHSTTECSVCHTETSGLTAVKNAHDVMKKIGIGLVIAVIAGLLLNYTIARIRLRNKKD